MALSEFKATLVYTGVKSNRAHTFDASTWDHTPLIPALWRCCNMAGGDFLPLRIHGDRPALSA